jgi:hypothetical protein
VLLIDGEGNAAGEEWQVDYEVVKRDEELQ